MSLWHCLDEIGDAVCEPLLTAVFGDASDDEYDSFQDAQSMLESSISSGVDSDESKNSPVPFRTISFPSEETTSEEGGTMLYSQAPCNRSGLLTPVPFDEIPFEEMTLSWDDSASFMTPREREEENEEPWDENENDLLGDFDNIMEATRSDVGVGFEEDSSTEKRHILAINEDVDSQTWNSMVSTSSINSDGSSPFLKRRMNIAFAKIRAAINAQRSISPILCELTRLEEKFLDESGTGDEKKKSLPIANYPTRTCTVESSPERSENSLQAVQETTKCLDNLLESSSEAPFQKLEELSDCEESSVESWGIAPLQQVAQHMMMNIDVAFEHNQANAAIAIQKIARGFLARHFKRRKLNLLIQDTAALSIQDAWLSHRLRKRVSMKINRQENPCVSLQTVIVSPGACEILFPGQTIPNEVQSTLTPQGSERVEHLKEPRRLTRSLSVRHKRKPRKPICTGQSRPSFTSDDDEMVCVVTGNIDGSPFPTVWRVGRHRKEFHCARKMMATLPRIREEFQDSDYDAPSQRKRLHSTNDFHDGTARYRDCDGEYDYCEELEISRVDDGRGPLSLIPPPQIRPYREFPTDNAPRWSICNTRYAEEKSSSGLSARIFGIVELAIWLQSTTRKRQCHKRYIKVRDAIISMQAVFRKKLSHKHQLEDRNLASKSIALLIKKVESKAREESLVFLTHTVTYPPRILPRTALKDSLLSRGKSNQVKSWPVPKTHYHHRTQPLTQPIGRNITAASLQNHRCVFVQKETSFGKESDEYVRKRLDSLEDSAVKLIQAKFRGSRERRTYQQSLQAIVLIQSYARTRIRVQQCRSEIPCALAICEVATKSTPDTGRIVDPKSSGNAMTSQTESKARRRRKKKKKNKRETRRKNGKQYTAFHMGN